MPLLQPVSSLSLHQGHPPALSLPRYLHCLRNDYTARSVDQRRLISCDRTVATAADTPPAPITGPPAWWYGNPRTRGIEMHDNRCHAPTPVSHRPYHHATKSLPPRIEPQLQHGGGTPHVGKSRGRGEHADANRGEVVIIWEAFRHVQFIDLACRPTGCAPSGTRCRERRRGVCKSRRTRPCGVFWVPDRRMNFEQSEQEEHNGQAAG